MKKSNTRTTIDIPTALYSQLKKRAAAEGRPVKALLLEGAELVLKNDGKLHRVKLPIIPSDRPGSLQLTNEQIYEIIPFP